MQTKVGVEAGHAAPLQKILERDGPLARKRVDQLGGQNVTAAEPLGELGAGRECGDVRRGLAVNGPQP